MESVFADTHQWPVPCVHPSVYPRSTPVLMQLSSEDYFDPNPQRQSQATWTPNCACDPGIESCTSVCIVAWSDSALDHSAFIQGINQILLNEFDIGSSLQDNSVVSVCHVCQYPKSLSNQCIHVILIPCVFVNFISRLLQVDWVWHLCQSRRGLDHAFERCSALLSIYMHPMDYSVVTLLTNQVCLDYEHKGNTMMCDRGCRLRNQPIDDNSIQDYSVDDYSVDDYQTQDHQTQVHQTQDHQTQDHQTQDHQTQDHQTQVHQTQVPCVSTVMSVVVDLLCRHLDIHDLLELSMTCSTLRKSVDKHCFRLPNQLMLLQQPLIPPSTDRLHALAVDGILTFSIKTDNLFNPVHSDDMMACMPYLRSIETSSALDISQHVQYMPSLRRIILSDHMNYVTTLDLSCLIHLVQLCIDVHSINNLILPCSISHLEIKAVEVKCIQVLNLTIDTTPSRCCLNRLSLVIDRPPKDIPFDLAQHMHHLVMQPISLSLSQVHSIEFGVFGPFNNLCPKDHTIQCQYLEVTSTLDLEQYLRTFCNVEYVSWLVWDRIMATMEPIHMLDLQPRLRAIGVWSHIGRNQILMAQAVTPAGWHPMDLDDGIVIYRNTDTLHSRRVRDFFGIL